MAGNGPLTSDDLAPGDVLETYDVVFYQKNTAILKNHTGLLVLMTRNSMGYVPPVRKEHIVIVSVIIYLSTRYLLAVHEGRMGFLVLTSDNSLKKVVQT